MTKRDARDIAAPGSLCAPDSRRGVVVSPHTLGDPVNDEELLRVHAWLRARDAIPLLRRSVDDAVKYVLDGARTWRFDLRSPDVDSDERASVGTKLQYHVIETLGLQKAPPLDTWIEGVPVELKGTTGRTWMIPREGQCAVTLLIRIDTQNHEFSAWLMRTHRAWLNESTNQDGKRTPRAEAVSRYALVVVPPTPLPPEPLRQLSSEQLALVLGPGGMRTRITALFEALPETVIPRGTIATVGAGLSDPLRRAREAKPALFDRGLVVLIGTWTQELETARELGFDLSNEAWVAIRRSTFEAHGVDVPPLSFTSPPHD